MKSDINSCLEYLRRVGEYALTGDNAVKILFEEKKPWQIELKEPLEAICTNGARHKSLNLITPEQLGQYALLAPKIVQESSKVKYQGHEVRVAKPEHLILLDMVFGHDYGRNAYDLIHFFGKKIDFEEIRNLFKLSGNYDALYEKLTQAHYELV